MATLLLPHSLRCPRERAFVPPSGVAAVAQGIPLHGLSRRCVLFRFGHLLGCESLVLGPALSLFREVGWNANMTPRTLHQ